jgi:hypothetical protein
VDYQLESNGISVQQSTTSKHAWTEGEQQPTEEEEESQQVDEDNIPIALFNLLQKDVEELRRTNNEKEVELSDKDTVIESLEKKVDILEKSKQSDIKVYKRKISDLQEELGHPRGGTSSAALTQQETKLKMEKIEGKRKSTAVTISGTKTNTKK